MNLTQNNIIVKGPLSPEVVKGCAVGFVLAVAVIGMLMVAIQLVR